MWALNFGPYGEQLALTWQDGKVSEAHGPRQRRSLRLHTSLLLLWTYSAGHGLPDHAASALLEASLHRAAAPTELRWGPWPVPASGGLANGQGWVGWARLLA